jgi:uncharacterized protein YbbC (DUF1343 family)
MKLTLFLIAIISISFIACEDKPEQTDLEQVNAAIDTVLTGADILITEKKQLIEGKAVGLVTNHTALLSSGTHLADYLNNDTTVLLKALFGPEHGIRGSESAGASIESGIDKQTGVPVYSLYGETKKPTKEMMLGIDILIFDIQDIGARFYTYISTLYYVLQAGAEFNVPVIVLDRPNPIGGIKVDGPIRKEGLFSFVGIAPIPIMHGMTVGELAMLFTGEGYIGKGLSVDVTVVQMKHWSRDMYYDECGLQWIKPSPNMQTLETALVYPGTCLLEGTNASEGRGTETPFLTFGAPYVESESLAAFLDSLCNKGILIEPADFTPRSIEGASPNPKHKDTKCGGITIKIIDRDEFQPVAFGIAVVYALKTLYPDFAFKDRWFDLLAGDESVRKMLNEGSTPKEIVDIWQSGLNEFMQIRKTYLLYK